MMTTKVVTTKVVLRMNNELYHYGVPGMKWGVRRYQNKDGSLTPAGKRKYSKEFYKKIETGSREGKSWYVISDELSKDTKFKSAVAGMHDLRKAHKEFTKLSNQREEMYLKQSKKISKKEMDRMVNEEIEKNRDFYQDWKPRFFDKDGKPTSELKSYVEDAVLSEHASKSMSFNEIDKAYNQAWKNYDSLRTKAVKDLIGRHAHDYVSTYSMYGSSSSPVRQIVEQAISSADLEIERETT